MPTRELRLILFFLLGLFLGGFAVVASAETIPATTTGESATQYQCSTIADQVSYGAFFSTVEAACTASGGGYRSNSGVYRCWTLDNYNYPSGFFVCRGQNNPVYTCPTGQNWTLSGSSCSRPDCVSPSTRQADGTCSAAPQCTSEANAVLGTTRYQVSGTSGLYCVNNCLAYAAGDTNTVNGIKYQQMFVNGAGGAASSCTGSETVPVATPNPTSNHDTPCSQGEGVLTMGGKVQCVPASTPSATSPPVVTTKSSTDTKSDGSKVITTTTSTCTGDGACSTVTSTTVTNNTSGVAGIAGTPGTSVNAVNSPSSETSDFCAKNPSLQFCKGGMNEEKTQKDVLSEIKKLTTPDSGDDTALKNAGKFTTTAELIEADTNWADYAHGFKSDVNLNAKKSAWESAMTSGWFTPIPSTNCAPTTSKVGPWQWTLDVCPTAQKISEIGGYAMWFMLVIGVFVLLTDQSKGVI